MTRPDGILIWNYARFARDLDDSQYYKATLRKRGITIHSLTDPVPEGVYGQVVEVIIDIANQEKKRQTSRDAQRCLHELVEKHGCVPGTPPRGFMRVPVELGLRRDKTKRIANRWAPDPEWIPRIQKAFEMRASGASLQEINRATRIYHSLNSYTTFFSNALYRGTLVYGDLTIENYCEPIIDKEIWDIVQKISKGNAKHGHMKGLLNHPRRIRSNYLLSGLVKCGRCGTPLYGQVSPQRYGDAIESYRCSRGRRRRDCDLPRIPGYAFEQGILDKLQSVLTDPNFYIGIYRKAQAKQGKGIHEYKKKRQEKQKQINLLRRKIENLTAAIAESGHSKAILDSLAEHETEVADIQKEIEEIKKKEEQPLENYSDEELASYSMYLAEELQSRDIDDRRRVLRGLVYEIIVDRFEDVLKCKITIYIVSPRKAKHLSLNLPTSGPSVQRDSRSFRENNDYAWSVVSSHVSVGHFLFSWGKIILVSWK